MAVLRTVLRVVLVPVYMFVAPFARIGLWALGWALALAAVGSLLMTPGVGPGTLWRGALFALGAGVCHWIRAALPRQP